MSRNPSLRPIEEYAWYRPQKCYCDWCEKEIVIGQKINFVHLPSDRRLLVHSYHMDDIREGVTE